MMPSFISNIETEALLREDAPIWAFDPARSCVCWANAVGLKFWHARSIDELSEREFSSDSAIVKERLSGILRTLQDHECYTDNWTLYPNNQPMQVVLEFRPIRFEQGGSEGLLVKVVRQESLPLDDHSLRMFEATRTTSSIITMMSLDGRVLMQNPAALKCYGPELPEQSDVTDLQARITLQHHRAQVRAVVAQNTVLRFDTTVQTLDGLTRHSVMIRRGRDPVTGEPVILLSEDDISELSILYQDQKQQARVLEELVAERTDRLKRTTGRIDRALEVAAIWDWDIEADKLYFSDNFMQLLQYPRKEFIEKLRADGFEGIVHPEDYVKYLPVLARFLAHPDEPISHEMRCQTKTGEYLWIQIEGKCFCDDAGKPVRTAGLLTNITPKKQIEAKLLASQKLEAIGQLTGGIAHDFNNLLTVILGNAELLQEIGKFDPDLTSEIIGAVERGADLTRHLLAFARKQSLSPERFNVTVLASSMRDTLLRILSEAISVVYEEDVGLWDVFADTTQTEAAILNIALNARDAMPNGGTITIRAENVTITSDNQHAGPSLAPGDYVRIAISDTGTGMTTEIREKAFDPFFSSKEFGKGSGLGLSMVLGFSQQSGGSTDISSELGQGTTVSVYLPRSGAQTPMPKTKAASSVLDGHGEHIHILEDNDGVSAAVSKMVQSLGYRVTCSGTVEEALAAAKRHADIAVFIVDVILPGGQSGVDFASAVLKLRPDAKLILVSGYPKAQLMRDIAQAVDFKFLPKPFSRTQISNALANALRRPEVSMAK